MKRISYAAITAAVHDQCQGFYPMTLAGQEGETVYEVIRQKTDPHHETCNVRTRGDSYEWVQRRLKCKVSAESLPVLLRRLTERDYPEDDESMGLAESILQTLRFYDLETFCYEIVSPVDGVPEDSLQPAAEERD